MSKVDALVSVYWQIYVPIPFIEMPHIFVEDLLRARQYARYMDTNIKMTHACFLKDYLEHCVLKNFWPDATYYVQLLLFQKDCLLINTTVTFSHITTV